VLIVIIIAGYIKKITIASPVPILRQLEKKIIAEKENNIEPIIDGIISFLVNICVNIIRFCTNNTIIVNKKEMKNLQNSIFEIDAP